MECLEIKTIKTLFTDLGRIDKQALLLRSSLTDRERELLELRFIKGLSAKESADIVSLELDNYYKAYHKAMVKFYNWLTKQAELQKVNLLNVLKLGE